MRCATCEHEWHTDGCLGTVLIQRSINGHPYETFAQCECAGPKALASALA